MGRLLFGILFGGLVGLQGTVLQQPYVQSHFYYADTVIVSDNASTWIPEYTQPYDRPDVYKQWWKEISNCAHLNGNLKRIHWHWAIWPKDTFDGTGYFRCPSEAKRSAWCNGWWTSDSKHDIYIGKDHVLDRHTIEHEMLHDLLGQLNGKPLGPHHPLFKQCIDPLR